MSEHPNITQFSLGMEEHAEFNLGDSLPNLQTLRLDYSHHGLQFLEAMSDGEIHCGRD